MGKKKLLKEVAPVRVYGLGSLALTERSTTENNWVWRMRRTKQDYRRIAELPEDIGMKKHIK